MLAQFIAAFAATVGLISDGMQYGWSSPIVPLLEARNSPVQIEASDVVWLENISPLGALIGIPFTIYNVNRNGRKMSILVSAILKLFGWFLIGYASTVWILLLGRFLNGFAANAAFVSAPMYIAEISNKKIRGSLLSMVYIMMLLGIFLMYCIGPYTSILFSSLTGVFILSVQIVIFSLMPKSPYFLLLNGDVEKARLSLRWFQGSEDLDNEVKNLADVVERQQSERGRFIDLFKIDSNRKALIIMIFLNAIQHLSGISVMIMNLESILIQSSSIIDPRTATIVFALLMMIAAFSSSFLVDRVGRKVLLISSSFLTSVSLLVLAIYFTVINNAGYLPGYNWIPVVTVMIYAVVFKCGLGMVPIISTGELFPTSVKGMGMAVADSSYVIFTFISVYLYQYLVLNYNMEAPFYIFALCSFSSIFVTKYYIPETKGKSLEEIQMLLKHKGIANTYQLLQ